MLPEVIFPPLKGNSIFRLANSDGIDHPIACVGRNGGPYNLGHYSLGYFAAAKRLMESVRRDRTDIDILIYPVVHLYRHGIELGLKYLADRLPILLGGTGSFEWGHDLLANWRRVRQLMVQSRTHFPGERSIREKPLKSIDGILKQIVAIDPRGITFRYPSDGRGRNRLTRREHINYTNFGRYMNPMAELFERWMIATDQMIADMP